jgi:GTP pyrophosphokinase
MALHWPSDGSVYSVKLKLICVNRHGLLGEVSTIFGENKINISAANIRTSASNTAEIEVSIDVRDTAHLANVTSKISNCQDVIMIVRLDGNGRK